MGLFTFSQLTPREQQRFIDNTNDQAVNVSTVINRIYHPDTSKDHVYLRFSSKHKGKPTRAENGKILSVLQAPDSKHLLSKPVTSPTSAPATFAPNTDTLKQRRPHEKCLADMCIDASCSYGLFKNEAQSELIHDVFSSTRTGILSPAFAVFTDNLKCLSHTGKTPNWSNAQTRLLKTIDTTLKEFCDNIGYMIDTVAEGKTPYAKSCHFDPTCFLNMTAFRNCTKTTVIRSILQIVASSMAISEKPTDTTLSVLAQIEAAFNGRGEYPSCPGLLIHAPPGTGKSSYQTMVLGSLDTDNLSKTSIDNCPAILGRLVNAGFVLFTNWNEADQQTCPRVTIQPANVQAALLRKAPATLSVSQQKLRKEKADFYRRLAIANPTQAAAQSTPQPALSTSLGYQTIAKWEEVALRMRSTMTYVQVQEYLSQGMSIVFDLLKHAPNRLPKSLVLAKASPQVARTN